MIKDAEILNVKKTPKILYNEGFNFKKKYRDSYIIQICSFYIIQICSFYIIQIYGFYIIENNKAICIKSCT